MHLSNLLKQGGERRKEVVRQLGKQLICACVVLAFAAVPVMAQSSAFGQAAAGISTETVSDARYVAIIIMTIVGLSLVAFHEHGVVGRIITMVSCFIFALLATPIVGYILSL